MAIFPIFGGILGILNNFLAIMTYERRGKGYAQMILVFSAIIIVISFIVLLRLLGKI